MDRKCEVIVDPDRAPIIKRMFERVAYEKWSGRKLYHWLKFELNFRTKSNHYLSLANIYRIIQSHFYYRVFQYPENGGNWYTGKHRPIINKDLFDKVQEQLKRDHFTRENREFAFTKLITCGCGSGITACEKYKKLKDGTTAKYIYYGCTKSRNLHCKEGYIREEELIGQLINIIDRLDVNELGMKQKFEEEVARFNKFQKSVLGLTKDPAKEILGIDLKAYAKYLLREGSMIEKRELLSCFKSRLTIKDKTVYLAK
jgi:hypothetical protein